MFSASQYILHVYSGLIYLLCKPIYTACIQWIDICFVHANIYCIRTLAADHLGLRWQTSACVTWKIASNKWIEQQANKLIYCRYIKNPEPIKTTSEKKSLPTSQTLLMETLMANLYIRTQWKKKMLTSNIYKKNLSNVTKIRLSYSRYRSNTESRKIFHENKC